MLYQDDLQRLLDHQTDSLVKHVIDCYERTTLQGTTRLPREIFMLEGYSGALTRTLYNHLLSYPEARYLEIGTYKGSSTCSALYNNSNATATCIDNWSEFNGPKNEFYQNISTFTAKDQIKVIEQDCWTIDASSLSSHNFYLYDGDHSYESQRKAITHFQAALDDTFVLMVDDWNWKYVQQGTWDGIKDCNLEVVYKKEIFSNPTGQHVYQPLGYQQWWNGLFLAVLKKPQSNL